MAFFFFSPNMVASGLLDGALCALHSEKTENVKKIYGELEKKIENSHLLSCGEHFNKVGETLTRDFAMEQYFPGNCKKKDMIALR